MSGAVPASNLPASAEQPRPFFSRVESLRGLGAVAVAGYHFSGLPVHGVGLLPSEPWEGAGSFQNGLRWLGNMLLPGHAALMVFFVISGLVLRIALEYGPQRTGQAVGRFVIARCFRIYPIVMLSVSLIAVLGACELLPSRRGAEPLSARIVLANLLLLDVSMAPELWALQVEMLMVPVMLILYFLERSVGYRLVLGFGLVSTALAFAPRWALWPPLSTNLFAFVLGMVIPTAGRRFAVGLSSRAATSWTLSAGATLFLTGQCFGMYSRYSAILEAYAATVLVSLTAYRTDFGLLRFLDMRGLRWLGLSSGSYYVLHMMTVPVALAASSALIPAGWSASVPVLVGFLVLGGWLSALVPLSMCGFHAIEAPGVALGRWIMHLCRVDSRRESVDINYEISRRRAA